MMWLAHFDYTDEEPMNNTCLNNPFTIDGTVYILYLIRSDSGGYSMYKLNQKTMSPEKISTTFENFNSLPFFLSGCIVADKERVIVWNPKAHTIYRGLVVENGFIFREFETTGEIPNLTSGFAYCLYKGCLIIHGGLSFENPIEQISETFELNLEKLTWRKIETIATENARDELASITECFNAENLLVGDTMHVLNLITNDWKRVNSDPDQCEMEYSNTFVCCGNLYRYGRKNVDTPGIVYRFDEKKERWREVLSSSSHRLPRSFENVVVCGSRVYFMKDANRNFDITTMVSVLETNPSIFERSAPALSSFRVGRSIVEKAYPKSVQKQMELSKVDRKSDCLMHIF